MAIDTELPPKLCRYNMGTDEYEDMRTGKIVCPGTQKLPAPWITFGTWFDQKVEEVRKLGFPSEPPFKKRRHAAMLLAEKLVLDLMRGKIPPV